MLAPRFHLANLILAALFVGLFAAQAAMTWGGFFFIHGLVGTAVVLFVAYLLIVIMVSQHRDATGGRRPGN